MDGEKVRSLQLAYHQALDLAQFKAGFLARTSHELRSPLNRLIGLQQILLNDLCENRAEEKEFIAAEHTATLEILSLLDQVVAVSKVDITRVVPHPDGYKLGDVMAELEKFVGLQVADRGMKLLINNPIPATQVWVDFSWLLKTLTGLIELAVEAAQGGSVRLSIAQNHTHQQVELIITDDRPTASWNTLIAELQALSQADPLPPNLTPPTSEAAHPEQSSTMSGATISGATISGEVTLPTANPETHPNHLSPTLRFFIAKQTLEAMGASLTILTDHSSLTQSPGVASQQPQSPKTTPDYALQCCLPMVAPPTPAASNETAPAQPD